MTQEPESISRTAVLKAIESLGIDPNGLDSLWIGVEAQGHSYVSTHRNNEQGHTTSLHIPIE